MSKPTFDGHTSHKYHLLYTRFQTFSTLIMVCLWFNSKKGQLYRIAGCSFSASWERDGRVATEQLSMQRLRASGHVCCTHGLSQCNVFAYLTIPVALMAWSSATPSRIWPSLLHSWAWSSATSSRIWPSLLHSWLDPVQRLRLSGHFGCIRSLTREFDSWLNHKTLKALQGLNFFVKF